MDKGNNIRISTPSLNKNKFKTVLLYLVGQCAGKPNVGETVLHKLLYFSDFNYYEIYEEQLTGAAYKKMQHGPMAMEMKDAIGELVSEGKIQKIDAVYQGLPQTRYLNLALADLSAITAAEKKVIDDVIAQMGDWTAYKISNHSHEDKPWRATADNDIISYNLVFYREPTFSVREYPDDDDD